MTLQVTSPLTGSAQVGLTSPTYTLTTDQAPAYAAKQYAVTALGGTQTGVRIHAPSDPFTVTMIKPTAWKKIKQTVRNGVLGVFGIQPKNKVEIIVRKGVLCGPNSEVNVAVCRIGIETPSGAETYDAVNVSAMMSVLFGIAAQQPSNIGDTVKSGIA